MGAVMKKPLFEFIIAIRKKCLQTEEKIRADLDLTQGELYGLLALEPGEKIPGMTFSQRMGLSPSRGSRIVSRLMQNGYVTSEPVPENRRSVEVSLSLKGKQMRKSVERHMEECEKRITSQLDEKQTRDVRHALRLLVEVM
jgi:DNA-binding MarR family transcriptional regulator